MFGVPEYTWQAQKAAQMSTTRGGIISSYDSKWNNTNRKNNNM